MELIEAGFGHMPESVASKTEAVIWDLCRNRSVSRDYILPKKVSATPYPLSDLTLNEIPDGMVAAISISTQTLAAVVR